MAVLTGGPWVIQDHLLSLQRWKDNFNPSTATFDITPVDPISKSSSEFLGWAHVNRNRGICGNINYSGNNGGGGVWINGTEHRWQSFVYERIPQICQLCGRITHYATQCLSRPNEIVKEKELKTKCSSAKAEDRPWQAVPPCRKSQNSTTAHAKISIISKQESPTSNNQKYTPQGAKGAKTRTQGSGVYWDPWNRPCRRNHCMLETLNKDFQLYRQWTSYIFASGDALYEPMGHLRSWNKTQVGDLPTRVAKTHQRLGMLIEADQSEVLPSALWKGYVKPPISLLHYSDS
ncbi:hypothetical protein QJS10_CPA06g00990 [Acorus calamus]|uniref:Zinc knuckle CX2CX4HX4C domain-containing protein n=1 Tax=Acorus calamus TaxID=4465 RepID=A0AAV9EIR9_ACOCL|nr:hypothetical protein QJS10_CPA06g00990 [Acorus calamus]